MRIALGADHAGYELKQELKSYLVAHGHAVDDCGTASTASCDYPDFAHAVAVRVAGGSVERGILICGTGIGMAVAANKTPGVRAANITSELEAQLSREHNDLNVLTLGARILGEAQAKKIVDLWLATPFAGGRHQRRVDKITALEKEAAVRV
jgi:ribose 5-phosphate isomerase B